VLVVDDCSLDQTRTIVQEMITDVETKSAGKCLRLVARPVNEGPSAVRNCGIVQSTGDFVTFLDADDGWVGHGLQRLYERLVASEAIDLVQGQFVDRWPQATDGANDEVNGEIGLMNNPRFGNRVTSVLYRRTVFDRVGRFDETLRMGEDFDFWVRIHHHNLVIERIPIVVTYYTRRPNLDSDRATRYHRNLAHTLKRNLDRYREST